MKIRARSVEEYAMGLMCIGGEMKSVGFASLLPATYTYATRTLRQMQEKHQIYKFRYRDKQNYYRVKQPNGDSLCRDLPGDAFAHMDLMLNNGDARYGGSYEYRFRSRQRVDVINMLYHFGLPVDFMRVVLDREGEEDEDNRTVFSSPGELRDPVTFLPEVKMGEVHFFTARALKGEQSKLYSKSRQRLSRSIGFIVSSENIYSVYRVNHETTAWLGNVEEQGINNMLPVFRAGLEYYKEHPSVYPKSRAIVFGKTPELIMKILTLGNGGTYKPWTSYQETYFIPLGDSAELTTKMLTVPEWKSKVDTLFGLEKSKAHPNADGVLSDGRPVVNFLGCNANRMLELTGNIRREKPILIVHDWMKPVCENLYGSNISLRVMEQDEFSELVYEIEPTF